MLKVDVHGSCMIIFEPFSVLIKNQIYNGNVGCNLYTLVSFFLSLYK